MREGAGQPGKCPHGTGRRLGAIERTLGRARMECDVECDRAETVRQDYQVRMHASTADCRHSLDFDRVLRGR
jgi:hypothetical protein